MMSFTKLIGFIAVTIAAFSCSQKTGQWIIDSNEEWQQAEKVQTGFSYDNGFAVIQAETAVYKSVVHSFESKRAAKSIVFRQEPKWLNWKPVGEIGPANLRTPDLSQF